MDDISNLINKLKSIINVPVLDAKTIWEKISTRKDFSEMGFNSEEELKQWILSNPYTNV